MTQVYEALGVSISNSTGLAFQFSPFSCMYLRELNRVLHRCASIIWWDTAGFGVIRSVGQII